jgi:hypothetical protein
VWLRGCVRTRLRGKVQSKSQDNMEVVTMLQIDTVLPDHMRIAFCSRHRWPACAPRAKTNVWPADGSSQQPTHCEIHHTNRRQGSQQG